MEELGSLLENLQSQSQQLESTISSLAKTFTQAAVAQHEQEQPTPLVDQPIEQETEPAEPEQEESTTTKPNRRRGGMFGNQLTLDD